MDYSHRKESDTTERLLLCCIYFLKCLSDLLEFSDLLILWSLLNIKEFGVLYLHNFLNVFSSVLITHLAL